MILSYTYIFWRLSLFYCLVHYRTRIMEKCPVVDIYIPLPKSTNKISFNSLMKTVMNAVAYPNEDDNLVFVMCIWISFRLIILEWWLFTISF